MTEQYIPKLTAGPEKIKKWPGVKDRIREILELKENSGEPLFFMLENKLGSQSTSPLFQGEELRIRAPIVIMLNYLFPDFAEEDFDRIASGGGTQEELGAVSEKLAEVKGMVHFQPESVIEPSMEDLHLFQHLFSLYTNSRVIPPLQFVGSINKDKKADILCIAQMADLPGEEILGGLQNLVEKYVLLRALPSFLKKAGFAEQSQELIQTLAGLETLPFGEFIKKFKEITAKLPNQGIVENFRIQFRTDFTTFPEYSSSVIEALSELKCFEVAVVTIDPLSH